MDISTLQSNGLNEQVNLLNAQALKTQLKKLTLSDVNQSKTSEIEEAEVNKLPGSLPEKDSLSYQFNPKEKPTYNFDISAVKIDLNLEFSAENLRKTLNHVIGTENQLLEKNEDNNTDNNQKKENKITPFLNVGLSVDAERIQKKRVSGGNGRVSDVHVRYHSRTLSKEYVNRRLEQIKLQIQRRQQEEVDVRLSIMHRNGYRIVQQRISQRYREDVSLKAELLDKFSTVTNKIAAKQPESTGKFLNTTNKLVQNKRVSGKTVSKFFDVVESYVDKTRKALHSRINKFLNRISKDFNVDEDKLSEMRSTLHNKVDSFFDNVNAVINKLEGEAVKFLEDKNEMAVEENAPAELPENQEVIDQIA